MSAAKGNAYLDTIHGYLNPRMYEVLDLVNDVPVIISSIDEIINASTDIYPNPAKNTINIISNKAEMNIVEIYNLNGQLVYNKVLASTIANLDVSNLVTGLYIITIKSDATTIKRKLVIE